MIRNKRGLVFIIWLFFASVIFAQNISVASFKLLENDLTANTTGTMEKDQNGEVAALIKVITTEQGFSYNVGMAGIVKTVQHVGEIWVYVPHGVKKIMIRHQQLGSLSEDYYFQIPIEKAKTYEMKLTTGRVETIVTHAVNKQFVVFNVKPIDAVIELGDEVLTADSEGYATKSMPYGTYDYRVTCANYHTTAGKVTVNAQGKSEVDVTLRPNFGWIRFNGDSQYHGAHIYIDNERVGQLPLTTGNIKSGEHRVKIVKSMYKAHEQQVTVSDDKTTDVNVQLVPNFSTVTLTTDKDSEIWVDGSRRGKGRWTGPLEIGNYTVETKRESHRTMSEVVQIKSVEERTIELKSPTPIYGSLEISSTPLRATIYIDGEEVGETPLMKSDVLVGTRRVAFRKDGYLSVDKTVEVKENTENSVSVSMSKVQPVAPVVKPAEKSVSQPVKSYTPAPQQKTYSTPKVASSKKVKTPKKNEGWGGLVGVDAGYSTYGFNYGLEASAIYNRFSLTAGVKSHVMGKYKCWRYTFPIQLLRFNTKFGYTLGDKFQFTPQIGVVFGPSFFLGKNYVMGNDNSHNFDYDYFEYDEKIDYDTMNRNIVKFAKMRCGLVVGTRVEYRFDFGLGINVTPEYVIGEGVAVNAGVSMKF